jgi:hypothetical protein
MQLAAFAASSIGIMQQVTLAVCIISNFMTLSSTLHAAESEGMQLGV